MANDSIFTLFDIASISCMLMETLSITTLGLLTEIFFCYSFGCAVLGNRFNVTSHQNHHQHQRITKVRADKGYTKSSLQSAVVGEKIRIRILPVRSAKKSAVTVRILHVVQSANPHFTRSR